jgi:hypothetical protein
MKVKPLKDSEGETFGVKLIASSIKEKEIIRRFWKGGAKVNSVTGDYKRIEFTFADLIGT